MESKCILLGLGNPLLDISVNANQEFLDKYGLKRDNAVLAGEQHKPMYEDMIASFSQVDYVAGGATQNSLRVAQWLMEDLPNATVQMGCVGEDEWAHILKRKMEEIGVKTAYQVNPEQGTGTCAVLVTGEKRSLCAYLGAANFFTESHLNEPDHWMHVKSARFFYLAGFFLTVSVDSALLLAQHACDENKVYITNLSAPFLCQLFKEQQMKVMPYVDVLFGNESEFEVFAKEQNFETEDRKEIALKAAALPKKNSNRKRLVVLTQGGYNPVIVAYDGEISTYDVVPLPLEKIVDTNAAGDAFVGGFLAQYVQGKDIKECVRCGIYSAGVIIQRHGCTLPDKPDFK